MSLTREGLAEALRGVSALAGGDDVVSGGHLVWSSTCEAYAAIKLQLPERATPREFERVAGEAHRAIARASERTGTALESLIVEFVDGQGTVIGSKRFGGTKPPAGTAPPAGHTPIPGLREAPRAATGGSGIPGVVRVVAVGAGKGGVGKSTIALNLAVGLARRGHAVGLLDADIYGPSLPTMLGLGAHEPVVRDGQLQPFLVHGIKCMTIGKLVEPDKALIWRGPMAHGAFKQLAEQTRWGELDYLIVDLPPGTGDVSLTMAQTMRLAGAVIVCTPQKVAQDDAVRAAAMFRQLGIDVLGVVENMSCFVGDDGKTYEIFGRGGAEVMAQRLGVPFLGGVPITMSLRASGDAGNPSANFDPGDDAGRRLRDALEKLVTNLEGQVALASARQGASRPTLTIS